MNLIGWDTETTGVDLHHGAAPFFVSAYVEAEEVHHYWEWPVDASTRKVIIPPGDLQEIADLWNSNITDGGLNVFQNPKFDVSGFRQIGLWELLDLDKAWLSIRDTLLAGHLLASSLPHNLTDMVVQYLGINIESYETTLKIACNEARRYARSKLPEWRIAKEGLPEMPSAKSGSHKDKKGIESDSPWKFDTWLPRAIAKHLWETSESFKIWTSGKKHDKLPKLWAATIKKAAEAPGWEYHSPEVDLKNAHPWWTVLSEYGNTDTAVCPPLWRVMEKEIKSRGLWEIYLERLKVLPVTHRMESYGITANKTKKDLLVDEYLGDSAKCASICVNIAAENNYELVLPKGGLNNSLRKFCFEVLKLPPRYSKKSKTGEPTLDKIAMEYYEATLPERSQSKLFVKSLRSKRKRDTYVAYMESYQRYWLPWVPAFPGSVDENTGVGWYVLHPSLNPTGTDTLRWSSSSPNEQNVSKQGMYEGDPHTLRYLFGPAPGREWWSCDAKNIELRLPAYEAGEQEMIELFERPNDPPYYGSNHLLNFHTVYPDIWESELGKVCINPRCCNGKTVDNTRIGLHCKKKYASSWYQRCKNGGFAVQYGATDRADGRGTADIAFGRPGSHALLKSRFRMLETLNKKCIAHANKYGYVETMPDRTVNPNKGYPLICSRTENGGILPTVPLNYRIQSTAMDWMNKAMVRCDRQLGDWRKTEFDGWLIMQVHDEMVFDLPKRSHPKADLEQEKTGKRVFRTSNSSNLWRMRIIQNLMEQGGENLVPRVPTPVGIEYHEDNWASGFTVA